jgi:peptide/nickel transport system substrate-binding protein
MFRKLVAIAIGGALVLSACGGDDDDSTSDGSAAVDAPSTDAAAPGTSPVGTAAAEGSAPGSAPSSAGALRQGGTLRYAHANTPSRFDPHRSTIGQDIRFFAPVYDRLVHFDGNGDLVPGLATEWEFSDDGLQFTMTLREGVVFHDGAPFDSSAVKANIERGQTLEGSSIRSDLAEITTIDTPDPTTVVLTLSAPNSMLPGMLSHRAGAMVSPTAFENPDLDRAPVGAGPYRVTDYAEGSRIVYERFEDYWDPSIGGPDRIEVSVMPDSRTRLNALTSGEVDLAQIGASELSDAERNGLQTDSVPALTYLALLLNRTQEELADPLVRQAMNHAIDREAIAEAVYFGAAEPAVQPFPEGYFAYNPDFPGDHYAYDPERARELLAEAGYPDGFEIDMLVTALDVYTRAGEAVQAMLADVGITATIQQVDAAQSADIFYAQEQGDGLLSQWGGRPDPQITMELQFTSTGFSNPGRHTTPEMEEANRVTRAAVDPEARQAALLDEVAVVVEEAFQVPIVHDYAVHAWNDSVTSFDTLITGQVDFLAVSVAE